MRELPPRTTEIVRVPVTQEQRSIHDTYLNVVAMITRKRYLTEMDLLRLRKALLMCRLAADSTYHVDRIEPLFSGKLERFREILAELAGEEDRKVLVFSEWTRSLDLMEPMLKRLGVDFVRLDGSVPQTQRPQLVARFQETPDCRVFLTTNAGATGLNLQAANTIINFDLPWNPAVLEQRIARAHRMGQTQPVQVFLLVSEDTLEEKLLDTLAAKQTLSMASLDQDADVTEVALQSGIEELKRRLEVLIGAAPEAEPDESQRREREREAEELSRRARAQEAGGRLVAAAFDLLGTVLPGTTAVDENALERVRESLQQCVAKDGDGRTVLTVTLDDGAALEGLCRAAAALMAVSRS
jgi:superfamily II DNA/RNA helicase